MRPQVRLRAAAAAAVLAAAVLAACRAPEEPPAAPDPAYRAEIEDWRRHRDESLRRVDSWLTLVGLFWLEEGDSSFGADPGNDLVFPPPAPPAIGVFHRRGEEVRVAIAPGVEVTADGVPVTEAVLVDDGEGEPTILRFGSLSFYLIRRGERVGIRLKDRDSPALAAFAGIEHFPLAPAWRLAARFEPYDPPKLIRVPNVLGDVSEEPSPGALVFEVDGRSLRLDPTGDPAEGLFVVFGDATNGEGTYGGGRFLSVPPPAPDGTATLDFNRAYNPPCVFSPYATCPLPPRQNRLAVRIEAGEKMYGSGAGH